MNQLPPPATARHAIVRLAMLDTESPAVQETKLRVTNATAVITQAITQLGADNVAVAWLDDDHNLIETETAAA